MTDDWSDPDIEARIIACCDLVGIVRDHTDLAPRGAEWNGACPLHDDRSSSLWVNADKRVFYCFGCRAAGGPVEFVRLALGVDHAEAVRLLAEQAG